MPVAAVLWSREMLVALPCPIPYNKTAGAPHTGRNITLFVSLLFECSRQMAGLVEHTISLLILTVVFEQDPIVHFIAKDLPADRRAKHHRKPRAVDIKLRHIDFYF